MSEHILIVSGDPDDRAYELECPNGNGCSGWIECDQAHEVHGKSAADGPYDCEDDAPWEGCDDYEFHGVSHEWHHTCWTVPYVGCVVRGTSWDPPEGTHSLSPGRYPVKDTWDDETCWLELVTKEADDE